MEVKLGVTEPERFIVAMKQPAHSQAKLIARAERELSAFFSAVAGSFGPEEATLAAKDWLQQLEAIKTLPDSPGQLRLLSISAAVKLAKRVTRCLLIVGLCLVVTGAVNAQTPDPSPVDAPQPGVRPPLSPFPRFQDWRRGSGGIGAGTALALAEEGADVVIH